jgi:hypothetical protein
MGAIAIRTRYDEGTESAEVATSAVIAQKKPQKNETVELLLHVKQ